MQLNKLYLGHALPILERFPNDSVDLCVTSPPYWGVRQYGTKPVIWYPGHVSYMEHPACARRGEHFWIPDDKRSGEFCSSCGAWRGELGLEPNYSMFIEHLSTIFSEVRRVLKPNGCCYVVIGDTYWGGGQAQGHTPETTRFGSTSTLKRGHVLNPVARGPEYTEKCMVGIPMRFGLRMIDDGWILRSRIIWHKPNAMPECVSDRFTRDYEDIFFFTKNPQYAFNQQFDPFNPELLARYRREKEKQMNGKTGTKHEYATGEGMHTQYGAFEFYENEGRNKRCVWTIPLRKTRRDHYATFPEELVKPMILSGSPEGGIVLDPFFGTGTVGKVALDNNRSFVGIELLEDYAKMAQQRLQPILDQQLF